MKGIPQGRYTKELREEAVRMVMDGGITLPEAARRLSLPPSTLGNWVKAHKAGKLKEIGKNYRPLTEIEMELARVKKELAETRMERDLFKKSGRVLCEGVAARYAIMKELRLQYPIPHMSRVFNVSASGYYAWLDRPLSKRAQEEARLEIEIPAAHKRTRQSCGPERLQKELADNVIQAGVCRIKRIRKKLGICCKQQKKFKATTDSKHAHPVADNLLNQQFETTAPGKVWTADITYIPTDEGWLYLAGHKDLFTGELAGYAMGARMTKALVMQSLFCAVAAKRPEKGPIQLSYRCAPYYSKILFRKTMRSALEGAL